jgi:mRNA interferase RelE/StbE
MQTPGNNKMYCIEYLLDVVKKDIPELPKTAKKIIKAAIEERLTLDPIGFGKPLKYSLKGHRRLRVGDYRVVYRVDLHKQVVTIITIQHRKKVYEDF